MRRLLMRRYASAEETKSLNREPAGRNALYSASLKLARNLIDAGFPSFAIGVVLVGIEDLLDVLFTELCALSWRNKAFWEWKYRQHSKKRKYIHDKKSSAKLTVYGWLEFYNDSDDNIFEQLEQQFGYTFVEFDYDNLNEIRRKRNDVSHSLENAVDQTQFVETAVRIVQSYETILHETERIVPITSLVVVDTMPNNTVHALARIEKETFSQRLDSLIQWNPNDSDLQFLRQFLSKIPTVEAGSPEMISHISHEQHPPHLNPSIITTTRRRLDTDNNTPRIQVLNLIQSITNININVLLPDVNLPKLSVWDKAMLLIGVVVVIVVVALVIGVAALTPVLVVLLQGLRDFVARLLALFDGFLGELTDGNIYALAAIALPLVALMFIVAVRHIFPRRRKTWRERIMDRIGL